MAEPKIPNTTGGLGRAALVGVALLTGLAACASSPDVVPDAQRKVLHLELRDSSGETLLLPHGTGRPSLLFLFTTYDSASQLSFAPLIEQAELDPMFSVVAVALQPDPGQLLALYRSTLAIPFPVCFEPAATLLAGQTVLGAIGAVPQYVLLDSEGRVLRRHQGVLIGEALTDFLHP